MNKQEACELILTVIRRAPLLNTELPGVQMAMKVLSEEPKTESAPKKKTKKPCQAHSPKSPIVALPARA